MKTAKDSNADYVLIGALTLYGVGKKLYYKLLERNYPELLPKYRKLFKLFNQPPKSYQLTLERKAKIICEKYGIKHRLVNL
ncbi:MAG: hypothetical protein NXY59_01960 [Aigarchaeota archaeon]|nr:hypothetical protein [Candidatus Pelearchaeum maunauluense]